MNSIKKKLAFISTIVVLICALIMPGLALPALASSSYPLQPTDIEIVDALNYLRTIQQDDGNIGGFGTSAWAVMAITAAGEDPHAWKTSSGNPSIVDYLRDNSGLIQNTATDWERSILAITAAGENPSDFGGLDYVAKLKTFYDGTQIGDDDLLNDDFWGILALIAAGEPQSSLMVTSTAAFIEANQGFEGGWSFQVYGDSDTDDTGAALMALTAAGGASDPTIVDYAVMYMQYNQGLNGGFQNDPWGAENLASTVWAVDAIVAIGQDPISSDWTTGDNPIDYLLSLQDADGGFKWKDDSGSNKTWMTAYAIPALLGKPYPVAVYEAPPPAEPTIALTPSNLSFSATEGGANPASKTLEIWNSGTGTLSWSVSDDTDWLGLSPASGSSTGEIDEVTVSVDILSMDAGDYNATITIQDTGATNSPQTVSVSLHLAATPAEPTIAFSPSAFSFTATEGGANPASETLEIWNSGPGTLNWSVSDNASWVGLNPTSGSSTGDRSGVIVSAGISGMDAGDYSAAITIQDAEAANNPQTVLVSLHVGTGSERYDLTTSIGPDNCGSISMDPEQPGGYLEGSEVQLTASPAVGYAFGCWTGDLSGSVSPVTISMASDMNITASFVLFDTGDVTNVDLSMADPGVTAVSIEDFSIDDLSSVPADLEVQLAYVVDPAGTGNFGIRFTDIADASSMKVYKVADGDWTEFEAVVIGGNSVELTMDASDPVLAFCFSSGQVASSADPASFSISGLDISPARVRAGEQVRISVGITNDGGEVGSYRAVLYINGQQEIDRTVNISPGSTRNAAFNITRAKTGIYALSLGGQEGQFEVVAGGQTPSSAGIMVFAVIAVLVVLIVTALALIIRRRGGYA